MILGGHTQRGDNNAYCQDNDISWFDWNLMERNEDQVEFVRKLIAFTKRFPALQRRRFLLGQDLDGDGVPDLTWFSPNLGPPNWNDPEVRTLCCQLDTAEDGSTVDASRLYVVLNAPTSSRSGSVFRNWLRAADGFGPSTPASRQTRISRRLGRKCASIRRASTSPIRGARSYCWPGDCGRRA